MPGARASMVAGTRVRRPPGSAGWWRRTRPPGRALSTRARPRGHGRGCQRRLGGRPPAGSRAGAPPRGSRDRATVAGRIPPLTIAWRLPAAGRQRACGRLRGAGCRRARGRLTGAGLKRSRGGSAACEEELARDEQVLPLSPVGRLLPGRVPVLRLSVPAGGRWRELLAGSCHYDADGAAMDSCGRPIARIAGPAGRWQDPPGPCLPIRGHRAGTFGTGRSKAVFTACRAAHATTFRRAHLPTAFSPGPSVRLNRHA